MKSNIIDFIQRNESVNKILNEFRVEFMEIYKGLSKKEKDIAIKIGDEVFRRWIYSPLVLDTYINPNYLINDIAQNYYSGNYVIVPHITIREDDEGQVLFITNYFYYSEDEHPIFYDITKIIKAAKPVLTIKGQEYDEIRYDEELIEGLSFKSPFYQEFLLELLQRLQIIVQMKSIGCRCYQINDKSHSFIKLSKNKKLELILNETIEMVVDSINNVNFIEGLVAKGNVIRYLNNGITEDEYMAVLKEVDPMDKKFVNDVYRFSQGIDMKLMNSVELINSLGFSEIADFIIGRDIKKELDRSFTTVFAYYLGIITPNYGKPFLPYEVIKGVCEAKDSIESNFYIFDCDNIHDLSPLGKVLMHNFYDNYNNNSLEKFKISDINAAIETRKAQRKDMLKEYKKQKRQMLLNMEI